MNHPNQSVFQRSEPPRSKVESQSQRNQGAHPNSPRFVACLVLLPEDSQSLADLLQETSREGDPHKLVFFEIFSSSAAHKVHLEQDYMKRLFTTLEGKLAGAPIMTKLNAL
jgi:hypothetical protein